MPGVGATHEPQLIEARLQGKSTTEIAAELGMVTSAVSMTLAKPHIKAALEAANREAVEAIIDQRGEAVRVAFATLLRLAGGEPDADGKRTVHHAVQRAAATDLLDRCGVTREATVRVAGGLEVAVVLSSLSPAQLAAAAWNELDESRVVDVQEVENEAK